MPHPKKKPTVASMARELSLSSCTVSKILNRSFDGFTYAPDTIRKVEALAQRCGYVPNAHARSLRTRRSRTIGMVVPSGIPYFTGSLVENVEAELRTQGYETILAHSISDADREAHLIRNILSRGVDGLLWIPDSDQLSPEDLSLPPDFPLVLLDRPGCTRQFPSVITDNRTASRDLAREIAAMGVDSIAVLTSECGDKSLVEREEGVREVFHSRVQRFVVPNESGAAYQFLSTKLAELEGQSLLCLAQALALGAIDAIRDRAWLPGREIGFACFDELPLCRIWQPNLCRVEQDLVALGHEAVRLVLEKITRPGVQQAQEIRVPARLIRGDSAAPTQMKAG